MANHIPKIIHYFWFGGIPKPDSVEYCIKSWKQFCPDYQIIEWNESNYQMDKCEYIKQACHEKKWAFVSDYARLDVIYEYGGIYLDTDVEIVKNIDFLLENEVFFGFEKANENIAINTGQGFGAMPHSNVVKSLRDFYDGLSFYNSDGTLNLQPSPYYTTKCLLEFGLELNNKNQKIENIQIYNSNYFCPKNYITNIINITNETVSIHHFTTSWLSSKEKKKRRLLRKIDYIIHLPNMIIKKLIGDSNYNLLKERIKGRE